MTSVFQALVKRKVFHWTLGYLAAGWGTLEALGFFAALFGWGEAVVRIAAILLAAGLFAVIVLAWFHGSRGPQQATRVEVGLLAVVAIAGTAAAVAFGRPTTAGEEVDPGSVELALAVLPPAYPAGDPEQAYFVTGMHETLISQLAQVGALRVISRRSAARYADSDKSIPEIARELDVDAVIESSVATPGDSVRMEVRLIQAKPTERLVWSGSFGAAVRNVLAMHAQVARSIAREVRVDLSADEQTRLGTARTVDPETYRAYLRGMHELSKGGPANYERALEYLHEAVARDPGDALAYAGLALGYANIGHGFAPPPGVWPRALEAAQRAVQLDPDLAEAHAALADVMVYHAWDWEGAARAFRRANELNPNLAMNRYHYAWFLYLLGRLDEAIVQHRLAKRLDPLTPLHTAWLGYLYMMDGRPEEGAAEAREALALAPSAPSGLIVLGDALLAAGDLEGAIATHRQLADVVPPARWVLGRTLAEAGRLEEARRIRSELSAGEPTAFVAFGLVVLNAALGDLDEAFRWTELEPHHAWLPWLRVMHWADPLRRDPRYQDLLRRLDLPASSRPVLAAR